MGSIASRPPRVLINTGEVLPDGPEPDSEVSMVEVLQDKKTAPVSAGLKSALPSMIAKGKETLEQYTSKRSPIFTSAFSPI